ncbi:hypothetical protein CDU01_20325 [Cronobacter sakazakii]|uniref:hypothetical protein n=1 Tax=Cronobacter TaxID=413496 RepID=UPI000BE7BCFA|nr:MULTISPECIES: hypothetical protein [Cronobacter]EBX8442752.1 hypothetical protein [Salmonella enterica subsp. enterica serovar Oranienburg]ELY2676821.1 hypothetical protein [Cronobacter sakazakii]ELY2751970.1 hypothetical protein [Cronobacter sakazakii]ELY2794065.1 hypothetical protein [Cronobacter sakazakii]ELY2905555.1 hypothetical protein [Cronobacter sakazakii]
MSNDIELNSEDDSENEGNGNAKNIKNNNISAITTDLSRDATRDDAQGEISKNFGTGEHAKINLILYIISTTLIIFSSIAAALMVINVFGFNTEKIIQYIKDLWAVFTPIITLGLGYLFGANKNEESKQNDKDK